MEIGNTVQLKDTSINNKSLAEIGKVIDIDDVGVIRVEWKLCKTSHHTDELIIIEEKE